MITTNQNPPAQRLDVLIDFLSETPGRLRGMILTHHSSHAQDALFYLVNIFVHNKTHFIIQRLNPALDPIMPSPTDQ
jgi:uncharacterized protein YpiB (UPF0302 family)